MGQEPKNNKCLKGSEHKMIKGWKLIKLCPAQVKCLINSCCIFLIMIIIIASVPARLFPVTDAFVTASSWVSLEHLPSYLSKVNSQHYLLRLIKVFLTWDPREKFIPQCLCWVNSIKCVSLKLIKNCIEVKIKWRKKRDCEKQNIPLFFKQFK